MNTIQDRRKANKMVKTYEKLTANINTETKELHSIGLKEASRELERAKQRMHRAKEVVGVRIMVLKARRKP